MNTLTFIAFACLAALAAAKPSGHWDDGQWHGNHGHDDGQWHGDGGHWGGGWGGGDWDDGHWGGDWDDGDDGSWHGDGGGWGGWDGGHSDVVSTHSATIVGPSAGGVAHGYGWGNGWHGAGWGGHGHGVAVVGPHTVPAAIVGPAGKVVADGLYGVGHGHGHHGHW